MRDATPRHTVTVRDGERDARRRSLAAERSRRYRARLRARIQQSTEKRVVATTTSESNSAAKETPKKPMIRSVTRSREWFPDRPLDAAGRQVQEVCSDIFPVDDWGAMQIVSAAQSVVPDIVVGDLLDAVRRAYREKLKDKANPQRSAMLFVTTVPAVLRQYYRRAA